MGCPTYKREGDSIFSPGIRAEIDRNKADILARDHIISGKSGFRRIQASDFAYRLSNVITHHLDRCSMAFGLEARVPFLDHQFVEQCAKIPDKLKLKRLVEKSILRKSMQEDLPG